MFVLSLFDLYFLGANHSIFLHFSAISSSWLCINIWKIQQKWCGLYFTKYLNVGSSPWHDENCFDLFWTYFFWPLHWVDKITDYKKIEGGTRTMWCLNHKTSKHTCEKFSTYESLHSVWSGKKGLKFCYNIFSKCTPIILPSNLGLLH